jgi:hypothetical protein
MGTTWNKLLSCESSIWFVHLQIVVAAVERSSRALEMPFLFSFIPRIAHHRFPMTDTAQTDAILGCCEVAWMRPSGQSLAGRSGSGRGRSITGARPDNTTRCGRAVTYGVDQGAEAAMSISAYRIETSAIGC